MTKADIVEIISEKTGFTAKDVKIVIEQFLDEIKDFGTFKVKNHKARKARNPKTNQEVYVPSKKKAFFKVSKELNTLLN
jgi:nucleoid DNA-binding protein